MKIALVDEMKKIDKTAINEYGILELLLMENAGKETCKALDGLLHGLSGRTICVLAGTGNNGGDAFAAARHIANKGARTKIFMVGNPSHLTISAAKNRDIDVHMGIEVHLLDSEREWEKLQIVLRFADGVVDGVLGTGFKGMLRPDTARLIQLVNEAGKRVVSIDIPSGVEADTGAAVAGAVRASTTITLGLPKVGHFLCPGAACTGELLVDDIGIPSVLLDNEDIQQALLDRDTVVSVLLQRAIDVHKGNCGRILVVAGSRGMTGAAALSSNAVLRSGAGIVTLAVPEGIHDILEMKLTEVMTRPLPQIEPGILAQAALPELLELAESYDFVLLGPGMGRHPDTMELVRQFAVNTEKPLLLDADAIYAYRGQKERLKQCRQVPILTPHVGEMAALLGITVPELRQSLLEITRQAARECNAVFVVKSECTIVVYPDGTAFMNPIGNAGMATAGCGDVLAGTVAGLVNQVVAGLAPLAGVYLHSMAGDIAAEKYGDGLIASDITKEIPEARIRLMRGRKE
jgi:ADP-dependent NAD(P)H-hydrate dehydratase / NAD(P)H-hydrate epimerase